ncbi:MAG: T9SS type A sorting domain-containing protein [candidate division Zixibacteria bacterium]|nr:T9SS type A sorting domain-containing protein [candidate division Zixibacteria bacterium]
MTAKKLSSYLIAGIVLFTLAFMPSISHGQDRDSISVRYGGPNGGTINVDLDQHVDLPVFIFTGSNNWVADIHLVLGANLQYIDSLLSETEGEALYPFTEWDFASFSERYDDAQPEGWASQAFFGWARITPDVESPYLHTPVPSQVLSFVYKTNDDVNNIGDDAMAIGPGNSPFQGPSNAGDTLGELGYEVVEVFATFHFVGGGYIEGIVSTTGGDPIEGASVVNIETGKETFTDDTGFYHMGLYPGTHNFTYSHPDFLPADVSDIDIVVDVTVTQDVNLQQLGIISGEVSDNDGDPIEGVTVSTEGATDMTGADGTYSLTGLAAGSYDVTFSHDDYIDETVSGVDVEIDATTFVDVTLHQNGGLMGTVSDLYTGDPIEGIVVTIDGESDNTDNSGNYMIPDIAEGTYPVTFSHPDYFDTTITGVVIVLDDYTVLDMLLDDIVGIDDYNSSMPSVFSIKQNYPNPFNANTTIDYGIPEDATVTIDVYDLLGRRVATLVDGFQTAGYHTISWNAGNMTSGMYFYKIQANDYVEQKSMMLLK